MVTTGRKSPKSPASFHTADVLIAGAVMCLAEKFSNFICFRVCAPWMRLKPFLTDEGISYKLSGLKARVGIAGPGS